MKKAFSLIEIIMTVGIIGIVSMMVIPSLLSSIQEKAWNAQKKALLARFSQAIPMMDRITGYGTLSGTLSSGSSPQVVTKDTAAQTFLSEGLSKVMKMNQICMSDNIEDCNLPDKIATLDNKTRIPLSNLKTLFGLNDKFDNTRVYINNATTINEQLNTKAAAFETANGESILTYYNPDCSDNYFVYQAAYTQPKMCANFVYDLNGKKPPNMVGKDIGFITVLYSTDPVVVAPEPLLTNAGTNKKQTAGLDACFNQDKDSRLPDIDELSAMFYNKKLLGMESGGYWSGSNTSVGDSGNAWALVFGYGTRHNDSKTILNNIRCIKK